MADLALAGVIVGGESAVLDAPGNRRAVVRKKALADLLQHDLSLAGVIVGGEGEDRPEVIVPAVGEVKASQKDVVAEVQGGAPIAAQILRGSGLGQAVGAHQVLHGGLPFPNCVCILSLAGKYRKLHGD